MNFSRFQTLIISLFAVGFLQAQLVDWSLLDRVESSGNSEVLDFANQEDLTSVGGWFEGGVTVPTGAQFSANLRDGFLALYRRADLGEDWQLDRISHVQSVTGSCEIRSVVMDRTGSVWVGGVYSGDLLFSEGGLSLNELGEEQGFIAQYDPNQNIWLQAWAVPEIRITDIAVSPADIIVVTGENGFLQAYDFAGSLLWSRQAQVNLIFDQSLALDEVAENPNFGVFAAEVSGSQPIQLGNGQIRLSYPDQVVAPNVMSGFDFSLANGEAIDFQIDISQFNGGTVTFNANADANIQAVSTESWTVTQNGNSVTISGGLNEEPGADFSVDFEGVTELGVIVQYDEDSRGLNGDFDYLFSIGFFRNSQGTVFPWVDPAFDGLFEDVPFMLDLPNFGGSGIDFIFNEGNGWGPLHRIEFESGTQVNPLGGESDLVLIGFEPLQGRILWARSVGSEGNDELGEVAQSPFEESRLLFATDASAFAFESTSFPLVGGGVSSNGAVIRVGAEGDFLGWSQITESLAPGGVTEPGGLSISANGVSYATAVLRRDFRLGDDVVSQNNKFVLVEVNGRDQILNSFAAGGSSTETPPAVLVTSDLNTFVGGSFGGSGEILRLGAIQAFANAERQGFVGLIQPLANQERYLIQLPESPQGIDPILAALEAEDSSPMLLINEPQLGFFAVAAYLLDSSVNSLQSQGFLVEVDHPYFVQSGGAMPDPAWGRAQLNDYATSAPYLTPYSSAATSRPVRLYLIDTSSVNPNDYFNSNNNLTIEPTLYFPDVDETAVTHYKDHGTQMLSVIAGPDAGVALDTPIVVANYDIFNDATVEQTHASTITRALLEVRRDIAINHPFEPAVVCLALGSSLSFSTSDSLTLASAIDNVLLQGVPVVVAAGNNSANLDATPHLPADFGNTTGVFSFDSLPENGVICVGATTELGGAFSLSNQGSDVDFFAPGELVRAVDPISGMANSTTSGTSVATAYASGAALILKSANPYLSPNAVEALLKQETEISTGLDFLQIDPTKAPLGQDYDDFSTWFLLAGSSAGDDDGDLITNCIEYLLGTNPLVQDPPASLQLEIAPAALPNQYRLSISLADYLSDPSESTKLSDGVPFFFESNTALTNMPGWAGVSGVLDFSPSVDGQFTLSLEVSGLNPADFYRFRVDK